MQKRKFFVCAVDSLENARQVLPVFQELYKRRDTLRIEVALLVDMSSDAVDYMEEQDIFFDTVVIDENLKQLDSVGNVYGLKFDDWQPCVVVFGINSPADNYFRLRFTQLSQERGISTLWIDKGTTEEIVSVLIKEFVQ